MCATRSIIMIGTCNWLTSGDSPKSKHTCEACRKLKGQYSWITTGQKIQSSHSIIWRLELAICPSREWLAKAPYFAEKWLFIFLTYPTINTLIPTICWELIERILRKKPQRTTRLIHSQSYTFDSSNSSTLILSIDIPLGGFLAKSLPHHIHINEKVIWCLGSSSERINSFGWCNGLIAGSGKLEKIRFDITLLE